MAEQYATDDHGNRRDTCGWCVQVPTTTGWARATQTGCPVHGSAPTAADPTRLVEPFPAHPLTCGHCRNSAATHVIVSFLPPPLGRNTEIVCKSCAAYGMEVGALICHTVQTYPVTFSRPEQAPVGRSVEEENRG